MGARPGMVRPALEPMRYSMGSEPNVFNDLRLWMAEVAALDARLDAGYASVAKLGRTVTASKNGRVIGQFCQFCVGRYTAIDALKYTLEGYGTINMDALE